MVVAGLPAASSPAAAQEQSLVDLQLWGRLQGEFRINDDGLDLGTAWRQPGYDTSDWLEGVCTCGNGSSIGATMLTPHEDPGTSVYYVREFEVNDLYRVVSMFVEFQYDDAGILWLNGQEVYRTIRGNIPSEGEVPFDANPTNGGNEIQYIQIPGVNTIQGGQSFDVPEIPVDLLVEGTNTVAVQVWNRNTSNDLNFDMAFTVTIDENAQPPAPQVEPIQNRADELADNVSFDVIATPADGGALVFSATGLPPGISVSPNGTIAGSPTQIGDYTVEVTVDEVGGNESTITFDWRIDNAAPEVERPGDQQSGIGQVVSLQMVGSDPDGGPLTWSALDLPNGLSIDAGTGLITGAPTDEDTYDVRITATDDENGATTTRFLWQTSVPPIDITTPGDVSLVWGEPATLQVSAVDPLGGPLSYAANDLPNGLDINSSTGLITGVPDQIAETVTSVTVTGPSGIASASFVIDVPNLVPVVAPIDDVVGPGRVGRRIAVSASDPDFGPITLSVSGLPPGIDFNPDSDGQFGELLGRPTTEGVYSVTVSATDDEGDTASQSFTWRVQSSVNEPIVINEFMASNASILDPDADTPDWIEIANRAPVPIDLAGWVLSDSGSSWVIPPGVIIGPGAYLVLWASGDDRRDPAEPLHTDFALRRDGEYIGLVDPAGFVADEFRLVGPPDEEGLQPIVGYPRQLTDVSFGRSADGDELGYLAAPTLGTANSAASTMLEPQLRPFSDRIYNLGEPILRFVDAFDPDGDDLTYNAFGLPPFLSIDTDTGAISGTASEAGSWASTLEVSDPGGQSRTDDVEWTVLPTPAAPLKVVVNEFNAVRAGVLLLGGEDPAFVGDDALGNGGDWVELLVVDDVDLRGWTLEMWDRDNDDELLVQREEFVFADAPFLADVKAGTLITISQIRPDDLSWNPSVGDWTINLQSNAADEGAYITAASQSDFDTNNKNMHLLLRDSQGVLATPVVGETSAWDAEVGGVSSSEVQMLCTVPSNTVDALADYLDNGDYSTYGEPNRCFDEQVQPDGSIVTFDETQDLAPIRTAAGTAGGLSAELATSCLGSDGRFDVTITNTSGATRSAVVSVTGLADRTRSIPANGSLVETVTGRADGRYVVEVTSGPATISGALGVVACDPPRPEVDIAVSCLSTNGRVDVELFNDSPTQVVYAVFIGALAPRLRAVPAGDDAIVTVTGRRDGPLGIAVFGDGIEVARQTVDVTCDPQVEVAVAVSCLSGNGRIDIDLFNLSGSAASYRATVEGLGPRSVFLSSGARSTVTVTGRPDRVYAVSVTRNGTEISNENYTVDCDTDPPGPDPDPVSVAVSCLAGNGRIDVDLFNDQGSSAVYTVTVGSLADRVRAVDTMESATVAVTGRPDGPIDVVVRRDGGIVFAGTATVACDA